MRATDAGNAMLLDADAPALADGGAGYQDALRLWLRLLTCTALIEGEIRRRLRARFDVTLPRFDLMAQLDRAPGGMTLGALSRRMMVSNGNVTGLVERLAEHGLVAREPHPTDRRAAFVRLTAAGRAAFHAMAAAHAGWVVEICGAMPPADQREMLRLLAEMKRSARCAVGPEREMDDG